jgi:hypothetical protein
MLVLSAERNTHGRFSGRPCDLQKRERVMNERAWSRKTMVFAALAAVMAATMPQLVGAAARSNDRLAAGAGHQVTTSGAPGKVEPDPTDDGSIIIECVVLGEHPIAGAAPSISGMRLGSVPKHPLGPAKCWTHESKRIS